MLNICTPSVVQVTDEELDSYYNSFRGSAAETEELLELFTRHGGDIVKVFEYLPCSEPALDSHRFMDTVRTAISDGKVESSKKFTTWSKKVASTQPPKNPLKPKKTIKKDASSENALIAAIRNKVCAVTSACLLVNEL